MTLFVLAGIFVSIFIFKNLFMLTVYTRADEKFVP